MTKQDQKTTESVVSKDRARQLLRVLGLNDNDQNAVDTLHIALVDAWYDGYEAGKKGSLGR